MKNCPICQGLALDDLNDLMRCRACGHVFQHPLQRTVSYDAQYIQHYDSLPVREMSFLRLGFLKSFVRSGRLLDVGYGRGDFVHAARDGGFFAHGFDVHGVDRGVSEVDLATDQSRWDVVTFFDSLEHFEDLTPIRNLLRRSRYVMISLPWTPRWFPERRRWRHYKPGEHLHYFTPQSLAQLVNKDLLGCTNLEDALRRGESSEPNIFTAMFGPVCWERSRREGTTSREEDC